MPTSKKTIPLIMPTSIDISPSSLAYKYKFLSRLSTQFGDSFYTVNSKQFDNNCIDFLHAFQFEYPKTNLGYSYKTNYLPLFCSNANKLGLYAEVVSRFELNLALHLGVKAENIIFNGPAKSFADIKFALEAGIQINIDSIDEFKLIAKLRNSNPNTVFNLGIRCNFELNNIAPSRFGIMAPSEELQQLVKEINSWSSTHLKGLHTHICTPSKRVEEYSEMIHKVIDLADQLFPESPPEQLNLGGGFFSRMPESLKQRWKGRIPEFGDYAKAIAQPMWARYGSDNSPELILEPGLAVVADCMELVCRVTALKQLRNKNIAIVSASIYDIKPTKNTANLPIEVITEEKGDNKQCWDITGYTCMEDDILYRGYRGELNVGDFVVFSNVGAYTLVLNPPFIKLPPPVIMIENDKPIKELRSCDTETDFWQSFSF